MSSTGSLLSFHRTILYVTPLMIIVALIPIGAHGDIWSKQRLSKFGSHAVPPSPIRGSIPSSPIRSVSHAGVLTDEWVEMDAKLDMRAIVELLEEIPEVLHILRNMTNKIDTFDEELILSAILPHISDLKENLGSGFDEINRTIHDVMQDWHDGPLGSTEKQLSHILEYLENSSQKPAQCELTKLERGFESFTKTTEELMGHIKQQISTEMAKDEEGLSGISENHKLLLEILRILDGLADKAFGGMAGGECNVCQKLENIFHKGKDSSNTLSLLGNLVESIPQEVGDVIKSDGGLGGIRKEIQMLLEIDEGIKGSIGQLSQVIEAMSSKTERYFNQHQKIIIETQYTVTETARAIQKTATSTEQAVKKMVQEAARAGRVVGATCN